MTNGTYQLNGNTVTLSKNTDKYLLFGNFMCADSLYAPMNIGNSKQFDVVGISDVGGIKFKYAFSSSGNVQLYVEGFDGNYRLSYSRPYTRYGPLIRVSGGSDFYFDNDSNRLYTSVYIKEGTDLRALAPVTVEIDGIEMDFDVKPRVLNGRTMVPLRAIFEALGAEVEWEQESQKVTATKYSKTVTLALGNTTAYVDEIPIALDVAAFAEAGRTLVPVRFISESFDCQVSWDNERKIVSIQKPNKYSEASNEFVKKVTKDIGITSIVNYESIAHSENYSGYVYIVGRATSYYNGKTSIAALDTLNRDICHIKTPYSFIDQSKMKRDPLPHVYVCIVANLERVWVQNNGAISFSSLSEEYSDIQVCYLEDLIQNPTSLADLSGAWTPATVEVEETTVEKIYRLVDDYSRKIGQPIVFARDYYTNALVREDGRSWDTHNAFSSNDGYLGYAFLPGNIAIQNYSSSYDLDIDKRYDAAYQKTGIELKRGYIQTIYVDSTEKLKFREGENAIIILEFYMKSVKQLDNYSLKHYYEDIRTYRVIDIIYYDEIPTELTTKYQ